MKFYFLSGDGEPVCYEPSYKELSTTNKGQKSITTMKAEFWEAVAKLGGIIDESGQCEVVISPSETNNQTIGVKYTVRRDIETYVGFGSSNEYSTTKISKTYNNNDGSQNTVVSGSICYALEMAVKRAKKNAIAMALGLPHGEVTGDEIISLDLLAKGIKPADVTNFVSQKQGSSYSSSKKYDKPSQSSSKPAWEKPATKPAPQTQSKPATAPITPIKQEPKSTPAPVAPSAPASSSGQDDDPANFVLTFGKHKGSTFRDLLYGKNNEKGYIEWLVKSDKDTPAKRAAIAMMEQYGELFSSGGDASNNVANNVVDYRAQLKMEWTKRGYVDNTDDGRAVIKKGIAWALKVEEASLKWEKVTQEQARQILDQIDVVFPLQSQEPQKIKSAPAAEITCAGFKDDGTPCGEVLPPAVIEFCNANKATFEGKYYCFPHQEPFLNSGNEGEIM